MVFARSSVSRFARPASSSLLASSRPSFAPRGATLLKQSGAVRTLTASANRQGKVLLVLYDVSSVLFELA